MHLHNSGMLGDAEHPARVCAGCNAAECMRWQCCLASTPHCEWQWHCNDTNAVRGQLRMVSCAGARACWHQRAGVQPELDMLRLRAFGGTLEMMRLAALVFSRRATSLHGIVVAAPRS